MTERQANDDERWVEGSLEAGADEGNQQVPNPETGVGLGAGAASSFEPEEDAGSDETR